MARGHWSDVRVTAVVSSHLGSVQPWEPLASDVLPALQARSAERPISSRFVPAGSSFDTILVLLILLHSQLTQLNSTNSAFGTVLNKYNLNNKKASKGDHYWEGHRIEELREKFVDLFPSLITMCYYSSVTKLFFLPLNSVNIFNHFICVWDCQILFK